MSVDGASVAAATVALGQSVTAYSIFLPPLREVRQASTRDSVMRGDVRLGQVAAGAVSLSVGTILSYLTKSAVPLVVSLITTLVIAAIYETALTGERIFE
jgi:hypothetical protein